MQIKVLLASGEVNLAPRSIRAALKSIFKQQFFMHLFVTLAAMWNRRLGNTLTRAPVESMSQIVASSSGRASPAHDSAFNAQAQNQATVSRHCIFPLHRIRLMHSRTRSRQRLLKSRHSIETGHGEDRAIDARAAPSLARPGQDLAASLDQRSSRVI
ncbi:hypothetical protein [Burkholderia lata]|uniref:hypothetical protein n=1 Tax=Burkholderia lata (strain ATCC 17760 / DSM 23089 / LMG 22485 / NCIMB 9086 / R18194 / 383) TaxID=482957 RepID=UPI00158314CB|nr:hypothetical protein [Burkholderia lata]